MQNFKFNAISSSQLLALLIYAAKNGTNGQALMLDFCLVKSANSSYRSRGSTKYEILAHLPWVGNSGGVFYIADEAGKLLNLKFDQFARWLAKLGSGTIGQAVQTQITLLDLSDLGRPMNADSAAGALSAFQSWAGGIKLQAEIDKTTETLASWGLEVTGSNDETLPPEPVLSDWWQAVGAGAQIDAQVSSILDGTSGDLEGDSGRGIFESAKGGRSSRTTEKKQALATKLALLNQIQNAQALVNDVITNSDIQNFPIAGGFDQSGGGNNGEEIPY